ncbi:MAG: glycosyltransferase [bacterium]
MEQKFKILYVSSTYDKSLILLKEIANYAKAFNIEVKLVILGKSQEASINNNFESIYIDVPPEHSKAFNSNPKYFKHIKTEIEKSIKDFNPDLIHSSVFSGICVDKSNIPSILTLQDEFISKLSWLKNNSAGFRTDIYKKLAEYALNEASSVTTGSRFLSDILSKVYKFKKPITVIYNGANEIKELSSPEKPYILTQINEHDSDKLNLLKNLSYKIPQNVKIRAIGMNNPIQPIKNVEFISSKEEMNKAFEESSIYLALSEYETSGHQEITAAMNGCAIVANDTPMSRELWNDCGCIFEHNNVNSLIRNVNNLIENPSRLVQHIKSCKSKALTDFNFKNTIAEYWNLYKGCSQKHFKTTQNNK